LIPRAASITIQLTNIQIRGFSQSKSDFPEFLQQSVTFVDFEGRKKEEATEGGITLVPRQSWGTADNRGSASSNGRLFLRQSSQAEPGNEAIITSRQLPA